MCSYKLQKVTKTNSLFVCQQAKRAEPSTVVDYEKIDEDARVSHEIWNIFGILVL